MGLNLLLIAVGLLICFGGIYLRKVCSAFLGLIWGALCSFAVILMTVGLWGIDEESFYIVAVCAVIFAIVSCIHDKLCAAINSFLSAFFFVAILLLVSDSMEGTALFLIAGIIAFVISLISIRIYDYSFILTTAFSGAFIASVGFCGVVYDAEVSDVLMELLFGDEATGIVVATTLILGTIGFFVQLRRIIKNKPKAKPINEQPAEYSDGSYETADLTEKKTPLFEGFAISEMKESWLLLLAPVLWQIAWPGVISPLLERLFPSLYFYMYKDRLIYFLPDLISSLLSGFALVTLIEAIKHRSRGFCFIWMIPSLLAAASKLLQVLGYLPHSAGYGTYSLIVSYLVSILVYLIPLLMWKIIPKMKYTLVETSTVKTWLFAAVSVVFVNKAIEIVLYCTRQFLINGFVWFESLFGDLCLLCIEAVWAAFLLKVFAERNKVSESDAT